MTMDDRILFDETELFQTLENGLDRLRPFSYDTKYRMLLGNSLISKLSQWDKNLRRQKDIPLTLVVCGEFKRGKSSLINAILGENVVTTNINTETITVNRISYGEHTNEIVLKGGKRVLLTDEELSCEKLQPILQELKQQGVTMLELKRPLEVLKQVSLLDTPGLGDSLKDFTDEVEYALRQADAVIYVFSISYPLSMQEQFFIKTAIKPQKYTELFLVANYCDMLETRQDLLRVEQTVCDRLADIMPGEKPMLLSALDERRRQLGKKPPNEDTADFLKDNFAAFRQRLQDLLDAKRSTVIPDRVYRMLYAMQQELDGDMEVILEGLSLDAQTLSEKKEQLRQAQHQQSQAQEAALRTVDEKAEQYKAQAIGWLTEFVEQMEQDVSSLSTLEAEDIKKYYSLFCVETMQLAIERCNDYFSQTLYDEIEDISVGVAKKLSLQGDKSMPAFRFALNNKSWTAGDTIEMAHTFAQNYLGFGSTLVTALAGIVREQQIKKSAPDLMANIRQQYTQLKASILPAVSENNERIAVAAKKQLMVYFADKRTQLEEQLDQTEMIARKDEAQKQQIRDAIAEMQQLLRQLQTELNG